MAQRRFGPTQAPGTAVIEAEGGRAIQPATLGATGHVGIYEKGRPFTLIPALQQGDFLRRLGSFIDGSEAPDAAFELYDRSNGAAKLWAVRVTGDNAAKSARQLYTRHVPVADFIARLAGSDGRLQKAALVRAHSEGRWGGRAYSFMVQLATATQFTETTVTIPNGDQIPGLFENVLEGGILFFADPPGNGMYRIVGNTSPDPVTGDVVVTVTSDAKIASFLAASGAGANARAGFFVQDPVVEQTTRGRTAGTRRGLGILLADSATGNKQFAASVYQDDAFVFSFDALALDPDSRYELTSVVNAFSSNFEVEFENVNTSFSFAVDTDARPGYTREIRRYQSGFVYFRHAFSYVKTSTNDDIGFVVFDPDNEVGNDDPMFPAVYKLTFTSPTTFTIEVEDAAASAVKYVGNATGTVGVKVATDSLGIPLPPFVVRPGKEAFTDGDVIVIQCDPLDHIVVEGAGRARGGYVYLDRTSDDRVLIQNSYPTAIELQGLPTTAPTDAKPISDSATTWVISKDVLTFPANYEVDIEVVTDKEGYYHIQIADTSYADADALLAALNGAQSLAGRDEFFVLTNDGSGNFTLGISRALYSSTQRGSECFIYLYGNAGAGTVIAIDPDENYITGTRGDEVRIEAPLFLHGGYDGETPTDSDFLRAYATLTSPFNLLRGQNLGLVKLGTPGVTSSAVQRAGLEYAAARNYQYRVEVPGSITSDTEAVDYINNTIGRSDYGVYAFPSYAYVKNPLGEGLVLRSLTGTIHGVEAAVARDYDGYHKAAAGESVRLPNVVKLPTDDRGTPLDLEYLNPRGAQGIVKKNGFYVVWGDRTMSSGTEWTWKHQREYMSHIENIILENYDWVMFMINDSTLWRSLETTFRQFFLPEYQKRALKGRTFEDAVQIKIDEDNNSPIVAAAGDVAAGIILNLADTVERFKVTISKKGIFDQAA